MSRIGKKPIALPEKVEVKVAAGTVEVKGPKGQLTYKLVDGVKVEKKDKTVEVTGTLDRVGRSVWGLTRTIVGNMVTGVSTGFKKELEFNGVGYKAAVSGTTLQLNLGHSHQIDYKLPKGIEVKVNKNLLTSTIKNIKTDELAPIRTQEVIGKILLTPYIDKEGNLHSGKYIHTIDEKPEWRIMNNGN